MRGGGMCREMAQISGIPAPVPSTGVGMALPGVDLSPWHQPWCKRPRRSVGISCATNAPERWD